jgi:hypothetical protein
VPSIAQSAGLVAGWPASGPAGSQLRWPARSAVGAPRRSRRRPRRRCGGACGCRPDDELDGVCQHGHALTPCPDVDVTVGPDRPHGRTVMGHTRLAFGWSGSSIRPAAPVPGRSGSSGRTSPRRTPPGSVLPRVTPTATVRGPDHHRTTGSLTVIPPGPTATNQTALNGIPAEPELARPYWNGLSGIWAVIS